MLIRTLPSMVIVKPLLWYISGMCSNDVT